MLAEWGAGALRISWQRRAAFATGVAVAVALAALCVARRSAPAPEPAVGDRRESAIGDLRAIWAHASATKTRADADALLDAVEAARLNCIYWLGFYWGGKAFFSNSFLPMPDDIEDGFDPLAYLCEEGHRRGIEIHVRFVNGAHGSQNPAPIFDAHPDWAEILPTGERKLWYDFNRPAARDFQANLMLEAATRYPIDGIQFDFVRFENPEGCLCDACRSEFKAQTGYSIDGWDETKLPTIVTLSANPLADVTTAEVVAEFGDRVPAITRNRLGKGETLLLNWHADSGPGRLPAMVLSRAFAEWGAAPGAIPCLHSQQAAGYHAKYGGKVGKLLASIGYRAEWVEPLDLLSAGAPSVALAPNLYRMTSEEAEAIGEMVQAGTRMAFIDGPIWAIGYEPLAQALGLSAEGDWFAGPVAMLPTTPSTLFDRGSDDLDRDQIAALPRLWWEFQAGHITDLVREVTSRARRLPRPVVVSADVFHRRSSAESLLQDWHRWVREDLIDYVVPMAYMHENDSLRLSILEWLATDPSCSHIVPGLAIYESDENPTPRPPAEVLEQMRICREAGFTGVSFFHHPTLSPELTQALTDGYFAQPAPRGPAFSGTRGTEPPAQAG